MVFKKGFVPWNKGLTAQTSKSIADQAKRFSVNFKHDDVTKEKLRVLANNRLKKDSTLIHLLTQNGHITSQKHPDIGKKLGQWVKDNPEHSKTVIRETMKKIPLQSLAGKASWAKNPEKIDNIKKWQIENPDKFREQQIKNGNNGKDLADYAKSHPDEYKKYGAMSIEKQFSKGFVSKPEKVMRSLLPSDFVHNVRLGDYVPDFCSHQRKMIIEVDGSRYHLHPDEIERDKRRDGYYEDKFGYKTFRINAEVLMLDLINIRQRIKEMFR